jgi:hypothetical protein
MFKCASPGCLKAGVSRCSICLREPYCSGECQKGDWKLHKLVCKTLKKLSYQLQPFQTALDVIREIREEIFIREEKVVQKDLSSRVLKHLITYAGHQFGSRIPGRVYRERDNGERSDNFRAEIQILIPLYTDLASTYHHILPNMRVWSNLVFPHFEKILDLLKPWYARLDSNSTSRIGILKKDQINDLLHAMSKAHREIIYVYNHRDQLDVAEIHGEQSLSYARQYEGTEAEKTDLLSRASTAYCEVRKRQYNFDEAVTLAEEAYDCRAVTYDPVHPNVQEAASVLIGCLIHKGDVYNARRFAEATLDSLKDPKNGLDQQGEAVAKGHYMLAKVISHAKADVVDLGMYTYKCIYSCIYIVIILIIFFSRHVHVYVYRYIHTYIHTYIHIYIYIYIYIHSESRNASKRSATY